MPEKNNTANGRRTESDVQLRSFEPSVAQRELKESAGQVKKKLGRLKEARQIPQGAMDKVVEL